MRSLLPIAIGICEKRILQAYEKECFYFSENYIRVTFPTSEKIYAEENVNGGVNGGVNDVENLIRMNSGINAKEITNKLKVSQRTPKLCLKQLRDEGKVEFNGSAKTCGYYTTEQN